MSYNQFQNEAGNLAFKQGHANHYSPASDLEKETKYRCYRCPHCGGQVTSVRGRGPGAPKKAFHEANGQTKHLADWSSLLGVTVPALNYYLKKKKWTMQDVYNRLTDPAYVKPGPAQGHNWRKAAKMKERK